MPTSASCRHLKPTLRHGPPWLAHLVVAVLLLVAGGASPLAHNDEARYLVPLPWHKPHIAKVFALGYSYLGLNFDYSHAAMQTIEQRSCVVGKMVGFAVDKKYGFDIDEPVGLTLTYAPKFTTAPFVVLWGKNGGEGHGRLEVRPEPGARFRTVHLTLDRARLAGLGTRGIDIAVASPTGEFALCELRLQRSYKTRPPTRFGKVHLKVMDASGRPIPARVGLYDATGRAPLPSRQAVPVHRFADTVRLVSVNPRAFWPSANRKAFYVNGSYEAKLPVGDYELAITHGPEFRVYHGRFVIAASQTNKVQIKLQRYANLPQEGWLSGDDHIHLARDDVDDPAVWAMVAAEDVHVGNLLQMGNIAGTYFQQPAWGKAGRFEINGHLVASGQEDPRTGQLGHTIQLNLQSPDHPSRDTYFLYHRVFARTLRQGGLPGFSHLNAGWFNVRQGMALSVPFGLVDFVEVLQYGRLRTSIWYRYLDLGYQMAPSAGSDFPYSDLPGVVRMYAQVAPGTADVADQWYQSLKEGHVYVTNGPFLDFTVNGHTMGDEIHVPRGTILHIAARARLNPDVDRLDRLELVLQGDVAATRSALGQDRVRLETQLKADHSMWIAVRAYGDRQELWNTTVAHSAPIYVVVDGEPWWNRQALPSLVTQQRRLLQEILTAPIVPREDLEYFETGKILQREWARQLPQLKLRVQQADRLYRRLLERAEQ